MITNSEYYSKKGSYNNLGKTQSYMKNKKISVVLKGEKTLVQLINLCYLRRTWNAINIYIIFIFA